MNECPRCGSLRSWLLGDGRRKRVVCAARWQRRYVWDAVRLPDVRKRVLLKRFVDGLASYRHDGRAVASLPTIARFYRCARACCTLEQPALRGAIVPLRVAQPSDTAVVVLRVALAASASAIRIVPEDEVTARTRLAGGAPTASCALIAQDRAGAVFAMRMRDGRAIVDRGTVDGIVGAAAEIGLFWQTLCEQLGARKRVLSSMLHLHLGEAAFRWNHRGEALLPLLHERLHTTPLDRIRPLLVRNRFDIADWRDC